MACFYKRPVLDVQWFDPQSQESRQWQDTEYGFGQAREKSFRKGSTIAPGLNRKGNENGELAGKIVFFTKAGRKTNYADLPLEPKIDVKPDTKIYAKSFFNVPIGMMPIGENNLSYRKHSDKPGAINYKGFGPVLLAPVARAIALFVNVDGVQHTNQIFCAESAKSPDNIPPEDEDDNDDVEKPPFISEPINGSFLTFAMSRSQDNFFFLHLPILPVHEDCTAVGTGSYALTVANAFHQLFCSLSTGRKHTVRISIQAYYDHSMFRYFILDPNMNPRGEWRDGLANEALNMPHYDPTTLVSSDKPLAEGTFLITLPGTFKKMVDGMLDRRPPKEKYEEDDLDAVRKDAGVVAMGQFVKKFGVQGLPDITVLISKKLELRPKDKASGTVHAYDYIEYAACWLDPDNSSPTGEGQMFEGAMAKGEIAPKDYSFTWQWHPITRNNEVIETEPLKVKNRYILARMVERRRSQMSQMNPMDLLKAPKFKGK